MKVQRLSVIVILAVLLAGLGLLGLNDTDIAIADTSIPDNEVTSSVSSDSSATATITITMYTVADE